MFSPEKIVAALVAVACLVMVLRLALGERRRARLDQAVSGFWAAWVAWSRKLVRLYRRETTRKEARKATQEVLQRMRQPVERQGNVITPDAFKRRGPSGGSSGRSSPETDEEV